MNNNNGSTGGTRRAAWTQLHARPLTNFFFFFPMWFNLVQNKSRYGPKYLLKKINLIYWLKYRFIIIIDLSFNSYIFTLLSIIALKLIYI